MAHAQGATAEGHIEAPGGTWCGTRCWRWRWGWNTACRSRRAWQGLRRAKLTKGRLERKMVRGICILDDTYNANPDSMVAALETLGQMPGRRIAVLGQMNELGAESERGHRRVGEAAAREKIDCVITVGGIAAGIAAAAREHGVKRALTPETTAEAAAILREHGAQRGHGADQGEPLGEDGNHCRGACPVMMYFLYHYRDHVLGAECLSLHHLPLDCGGGDRRSCCR